MAVNPAPLGIVNLKSTNQPRRAISYFANPAKVVAIADCLRVGTMSNATPKDIEDSLLCNHHDRPVKNRICRTVIISVQTPKNATKEQIEELVTRTSNAFHDLFTELNVPGAAWIHGNTKTIHGHGIFPNSDGRRTLNISPTVLRSLQGFKWTGELDSGRGKGERGALPVYTKAKELAVRELAKIIFESGGPDVGVEIEALEKAGIIDSIRRKKDGQPASFAFNKKRIRLSTLKNFAIEQKQQNKNNMITSFDPNKGPSEQLIDDLKKAGFDDTLIQGIFRKVKAARRLEIASSNNDTKIANDMNNQNEVK